MPQNYRNQFGRYPGEGRDEWRGGRFESNTDRDRYRSSDEQHSSDWKEGDRSRGYPRARSGNYSEEFGYRRGPERNEFRDRNSSQSYSRGRSGFGRDDQGEFDEGNRWSSGADRDDAYSGANYYRRDQRTSSLWRDAPQDSGSYFNTGSYVDGGDATRGFGADFERARARYENDSRRDYSSIDWRGGGTSGDYEQYGQSTYGSQGDFGRGPAQRDTSYARQRGDFHDEDRNRWGGQRAGSGSTGGAYGWDARSSFGGSTQSHRGRGPQGYQRSDERLREIICERLTDDPHIDATNISVDVTNQTVKLTGWVEDRRTKYEVEELIERLGSVKDIDNQLRVGSAQQPRSNEQAPIAGGSSRSGADRAASNSANVTSNSPTSSSTSRHN